MSMWNSYGRSRFEYNVLVYPSLRHPIPVLIRPVFHCPVATDGRRCIELKKEGISRHRNRLSPKLSGLIYQHWTEGGYSAVINGFKRNSAACSGLFLYRRACEWSAMWAYTGRAQDLLESVSHLKITSQHFSLCLFICSAAVNTLQHSTIAAACKVWVWQTPSVCALLWHRRFKYPSCWHTKSVLQ
jgi:hypothetical protein